MKDNKGDNLRGLVVVAIVLVFTASTFVCVMAFLQTILENFHA